MWRNKRVLVTGGVSFMGNHLVDSLLKIGTTIIVADDFSTAKLTNFEYPLRKGEIKNNWFFQSLSI